MLFSVPIEKSLRGCGTVTLPGLVECVKWTCEPVCPTLCQPAAYSRLMIVWLVIGIVASQSYV